MAAGMTIVGEDNLPDQWLRTMVTGQLELIQRLTMAHLNADIDNHLPLFWKPTIQLSVIFRLPEFEESA